jgi:hypothetical protein
MYIGTYPVKRLCCLVLFAAFAAAETTPISDENLRMTALHAIFPGMHIALAPAMRIDDSWPEQPKRNELDSPDALAKENVYRVIGKASNEAEKQASDQLITHKPSSTRLVRFQLFHWPASPGLLAVLQYKFEDAVPSMAFASIGLLLQLSNVNGGWQVSDRHLLDTTHHFTLQTVRVLDLDGDGIDDLVIESDFGGSETWGTNLLIFSLGAKLERTFETTSQISQRTDDRFSQVLDIPKTIQQGGKQVCFRKTTMFENGMLFNPPRVSSPCYEPNQDLDREASEERNKMLAPFAKE